jgi:hypothetical protein
MHPDLLELHQKEVLLDALKVTPHTAPSGAAAFAFKGRLRGESAPAPVYDLNANDKCDDELVWPLRLRRALKVEETSCDI